MNPRVYDTTKKAFVDTGTPLEYDPAVNAWRKVGGRAYDASINAWRDVWNDGGNLFSQNKISGGWISATFGGGAVEIGKKIMLRSYRASIISKNKIDFSKYAKLCIDYEILGIGASGNRNLRLFTTSGTTFSNAWPVNVTRTLTDIANNVDRTILKLDISKISEKAHFCIGLSEGSGGWTTNIYKMWLE